MRLTPREKELRGFLDAAKSLKLYRRAELTNESSGQNLVESLYVDALPKDHTLKTVLGGHTTFLIGRKGTGKSTIFQRAQAEIRKSSEHVSAYVDIKTIFESSSVDQSALQKAGATSGALSPEILSEFLLHKAFLSDVIREIKDQLKVRLKESFLQRIINHLNSSFDRLFEELDQLIGEIDNIELVNATGLFNSQTKSTSSSKRKSEQSGKMKGSISEKPSFEIETAGSSLHEAESSNADEYSQIFLRVFNPKELITKLRNLLSGFGVRTLYIFIDDFSELPESAMRVVVDTLLAPLNNWSGELVKFKIAAYPNRIYYGKIDKTKIDEIFLHIFKLYGSEDVGAMETKAIDFTRRLVITRLRHFCGRKSSLVTELDDEELWRHLFYATMGNPRNLGYILYFLYESTLIFEKRIGVRAIQEAARRYYEEKIEPYFSMSRFLHESFNERSSIFSLQELVDQIVDKARALRNNSALNSVEGRPPTSHFHVAKSLDSLLSTLELNFFVTMYYEMRDRDGKEITVFALNYGMCQKHSISFGRPVGKREERFRQYFAERVFDYSGLLRSFLETHQEIVCDSCGEKHRFEMLPAIRSFGMLCPKCRVGQCSVINLSRKYEKILREVDPALLLPKYELGILQTLHSEDRAMVASEIAAELDCSGQMVGRRAKFLDQKGLVERAVENASRYYSLTPLARTAYFSGTGTGTGTGSDEANADD